MRAAYHADPAVVAAGELRSELVTVLADDDDAICFGFDGGDRHDGTFRVTADAIVVEAFLGGAVLAPGEQRELHDRSAWKRAIRLPASTRGRSGPGGVASARVSAPYRVGWCSWYQYFHAVTEADVRANLARAGDWPIDVFQVDDGFQAAIGDWLQLAPTFPSPLDVLAADIDAAGYVAGLWIAPFLVAPHAEARARRIPTGSSGGASGRAGRRAASTRAWGGAVLRPRHDASRGARPPRTARPHDSSRWAGAT